MSRITLYHGTDMETFYNVQVRLDGLRPRSWTERGQWNEHPSHEDMVYLSDTYAAYFAATAGMNAGESECAILEVCVEVEDLYPDEDFLEQVSRSNRPDDCPDSMTPATMWFKNRIEGFKHYADDSLHHLGTCAVMGEVPRGCIQRAAIIAEPVHLVMGYCDPSISLMNHRLLGEHYRTMTQNLFDEPDTFTGLKVSVYDLTQQQEKAHG